MLPNETELQLIFAQLNYAHFHGEVPAHRICYNSRFSNVSGRITYKPPLIELSPKHFRRHPEALRDTLLHEMIHAWLYARGDDVGHGRAFKKKMREVGLASIYHDLGKAPPLSESTKRYLLRCERCKLELLRKRRPPPATSCGRCSRGRYDSRYPLTVFEIVGLREVGSARSAYPLPTRPM